MVDLKIIFGSGAQDGLGDGVMTQDQHNEGGIW